MLQTYAHAIHAAIVLSVKVKIFLQEYVEDAGVDPATSRMLSGALPFELTPLALKNSLSMSIQPLMNRFQNSVTTFS